MQKHLVERPETDFINFILKNESSLGCSIKINCMQQQMRMKCVHG